MQFGLTNAPIVFMYLMNNVLHKYIDKFLAVFIDDILIYSKSKEEHENHLKIVLQVLREHQLYAKLSKCDLFKDKIQYLGHVITKEGSSVDAEKTKAIEKWPVPKDVTDMRSFMVITCYYRRFIEGFSRTANPITSLQNKGKHFEWNKKCEESFKKLKELLTIAPILRIVDPKKTLLYALIHAMMALVGS